MCNIEGYSPEEADGRLGLRQGDDIGRVADDPRPLGRQRSTTRVTGRIKHGKTIGVVRTSGMCSLSSYGVFSYCIRDGRNADP